MPSSHRPATSQREVGEALDVASACLDAGSRPPTREELSVCEGLCTLITAHQAGQDQDVFPALVARHAELGPALRSLRQDHAVVARLVQELRAACAAEHHVDDLHARVVELRAVVLTHFEAEQHQLAPPEHPPAHRAVRCVPAAADDGGDVAPGDGGATPEDQASARRS